MCLCSLWPFDAPPPYEIMLSKVREATSMIDVVLYTKPGCPYCHMAKALLNRKGVRFSEIDISREPQRRPEMIDRANGRTTVPQIFIGETHVGGCDDLHALDRAGKLDPMLATSPTDV
jgi:glutaredoxin 3